MNLIQGSLTKIIATIGPASSSREVLRQMFIEGIDVCRLNFSHGTHEDHKKAIDLINELNTELGTNVATLGDLQGPKLRVGEIENNALVLEEGMQIRFTTQKCVGTTDGVYMSYQQFPQDVKAGEIVLIDDGKIKLEVVESDKKENVFLKVINGGTLSSRKGVNLPDTNISQPSLTEKDIEDVAFILKHNVQWIALSFVRKSKDILDLKELIGVSGKWVKVVAKIEKPEAINAIDEILDYTDAVMVARGDLGVETPFEQVPVLQKELIRKCIVKAKPVIVATQMMEGMINNFLPTRAEATDVSNAVVEGTDAVMLSGETSVGKYPIGTIRNMQKVIYSTEASGFSLEHDHMPDVNSMYFAEDTVCYNACKIAKAVSAAGIVVFTYSGGTAIYISSYRPGTKVFAFAVEDFIIKQLSLVRGVEAFHVDTKININEANDYAVDLLKEKGFVKEGDRLVHVAGIPMNRREPVNTIHISKV